MIGTALVLAGTAAASIISAANRRKKAQKAIEDLKKMQPKYRDAASIQLEGEQAIPFGYSPSERANFMQMQARRGNQARRLATDRNPNLAGAINAGINYGDIGANLQFAAQDANLRRSRVRDYVGNLTGQSNNQTRADIINKHDQEVAYGNAKMQANADIYNSLMQLGYAGASAANAKGGAGTGSVTPTTTPTYSQFNSGPGGYPNPPQYNSINSPALGNQPPANTAPPYQFQQTPYYSMPPKQLPPAAYFGETTGTPYRYNPYAPY